jgi:hypothetical protein
LPEINRSERYAINSRQPAKGLNAVQEYFLPLFDLAPDLPWESPRKPWNNKTLSKCDFGGVFCF